MTSQAIEALTTWAVLSPVILLFLASLIWLRRDADKHGQPGWIWAVGSLFAYPLGLILWLVLRVFAKPRSTASSG